MAKKKTTKVDVKKKPAKAKSITKSIDKSVSKLASKALSLVGKVAKKAAKPEKPQKVDKPAKAVAVKTKVEKNKPEVASKAVKSKAPDTGDTLIEMARQEMAAVKIGQVAEKAEKVSKFKAIKVERGNLADEKAKWIELNKRHGKDKANNYKMTEVFEASKPIQHKVLGWGFVLTNENDRLEVLFENGIKMLISNYKPN